MHKSQRRGGALVFVCLALFSVLCWFGFLCLGDLFLVTIHVADFVSFHNAYLIFSLMPLACICDSVTRPTSSPSDLQQG